MRFSRLSSRACLWSPRLCAPRFRISRRHRTLPTAAFRIASLRWLLLHDILPAFDDLYRCVQSLRATPESSPLASLREFIEWGFSTFLASWKELDFRQCIPLGSVLSPIDMRRARWSSGQSFPRDSRRGGPGRVSACRSSTPASACRGRSAGSNCCYSLGRKADLMMHGWECWKS